MVVTRMSGVGSRVSGSTRATFWGSERTAAPATADRGPRKLLPEELLVLRDPSRAPIGALTLRSALLKTGRPHTCALCGLADSWRGERLVLQIDHSNGLHFDNRPENLRFLCPNCHSQTPSFGRKNRAYAAAGGEVFYPSRDGLSPMASSPKLSTGDAAGVAELA